MEIIIYEGRPQETKIRLDKEIQAYNLLDNAGIKYKTADHPEAFGMEICDIISRELETDICKNLFLCNRQQTSFYLLMMPEHKRFKTKDITAQLETSRLSFADEGHMAEMMDLTPGSVTVLGLSNDIDNKIQLVIDQDLLKNETVGIHPMINTSTVKLSTTDLTEKLLPILKHKAIYVTLPWYED